MNNPSRAPQLVMWLRERARATGRAPKDESFTETANLIEELVYELKCRTESAQVWYRALAEQNRQMREVLGKLEAHRSQYPDSMWESLLKESQQSNAAASYRIGERYVTHVPAMLFEEIRQAFALTPHEAEQQAKQNAEKAELVHWWFDEANEEARESIRVKRADSTTAWSVEQWLAEVKAAKEPK
jgi:hypothetical protein